jgi:hypothetical protein
MLLPVVVRREPAGPAAASSLELRIGDVSIRVPGGADVAYVASLVDALRR